MKEIKHHPGDGIPNLPKVMAMIRMAVESGTHSDITRTVCHVCREWCNGHYYVNEQGTRMCAACADIIGESHTSITNHHFQRSVMSLITTTLPPMTETAECQQCENPIPQGDIVITTRTKGLGGNKMQHIEAHCPHCKCVNVMDREFDGVYWRRLGDIKVIPATGMTPSQQRRREDLSHARRLEQDATDPGRDYME